jgi:hypothetical protein
MSWGFLQFFAPSSCARCPETPNQFHNMSSTLFLVLSKAHAVPFYTPLEKPLKSGDMPQDANIAMVSPPESENNDTQQQLKCRLSATFKISIITFPAFSTRSVSFLLSPEAPVQYQ